ncbi:hypothetical protein R1flu_004557 [Riccia fluitans]|uniref:Bulb-type lectin domain-containing protein n=1 Tax=Riccia fluitans TaxID=41844 RepID=A0ABD1YQN8_9MARC
MERSRVGGSTIFFLVCTYVLLCGTAGTDALKFSYTFGRGPMNCTDNFPNGVVCTNPIRSMNTGGKGDSRHSNIISLPGVDNYALGFQNATTGSHYLAIYQYNSKTGLAGNSIWYAEEEEGGVAVQVPGTPSLIFTKDGNLELWSRGVLRWSLGTSRLGVKILEFTVSSKQKSAAGNLVLYNKQNHVVWQSMPMNQGEGFSLYTQYTPNFECTNKRQVVSCMPFIDMALSPGDRKHRNIISDSNDGKYALGFESTSGGFFLSIYKFNPSTNTAGAPIWRARTSNGQFVKVDENATFTIGQGTLTLKNSSGKQVWATGTVGGGYWLSLEYDTGILMLKSNMKAIVWQSKWSGGKGN